MNETIALLERINKELNERLDEMRIEISEMRQELMEVTQGSRKRNILPIEEAWKELGYKSYRACYDRITSGLYRVGKEAIDRRGPSAKQACWFLDIDKCRERDNQPARKRA